MSEEAKLLKDAIDAYRVVHGTPQAEAAARDLRAVVDGLKRGGRR